MPIGLATDPYGLQDDPTAPPKPKPLPTTGGGALAPPIGLAPSGAAAPTGAPVQTPPMTPPSGVGLAVAVPHTATITETAGTLAPTGTYIEPPNPTEGIAGGMPPMTFPSTQVDPNRRLGLAQSAYDTFAEQDAPRYTHDLRLATQQAAGQGRVGSGMLRTSYGDLNANRELRLEGERERLMNAAVEGQIGDEQEAARLDFQKAQAVQQAAQFGASLAQQKELAELADKTANRQLDLSTVQGKNALLLELARIMGGPSGNVDPAFIAAILKTFGVDMNEVPKQGSTIALEQDTAQSETATRQARLSALRHQLASVPPSSPQHQWLQQQIAALESA